MQKGVYKGILIKDFNRQTKEAIEQFLLGVGADSLPGGGIRHADHGSKGVTRPGMGNGVSRVAVQGRQGAAHGEQGNSNAISPAGSSVSLKKPTHSSHSQDGTSLRSISQSQSVLGNENGVVRHPPQADFTRFTFGYGADESGGGSRSGDYERGSDYRGGLAYRGGVGRLGQPSNQAESLWRRQGQTRPEQMGHELASQNDACENTWSLSQRRGHQRLMPASAKSGEYNLPETNFTGKTIRAIEAEDEVSKYVNRNTTRHANGEIDSMDGGPVDGSRGAVKGAHQEATNTVKGAHQQATNNFHYGAGADNYGGDSGGNFFHRNALHQRGAETHSPQQGGCQPLQYSQFRYQPDSIEVAPARLPAAPHYSNPAAASASHETPSFDQPNFSPFRWQSKANPLSNAPQLPSQRPQPLRTHLHCGPPHPPGSAQQGSGSHQLSSGIVSSTPKPSNSWEQETPSHANQLQYDGQLDAHRPFSLQPYTHHQPKSSKQHQPSKNTYPVNHYDQYQASTGQYSTNTGQYSASTGQYSTKTGQCWPNKANQVATKGTSKGLFSHLPTKRAGNSAWEIAQPAMPDRNYKMGIDEEWNRSRPEDDYRLYYVLSKFPGITEFKLNQKAVIKCGLHNHDLFVCMPTGGGKSLTFQVLTFLDPGVYLVILPLISLIIDQEWQAQRLGIEAYSLTGAVSSAATKAVFKRLNSFEQGSRSVVLFVTPEKLNLSPQLNNILDYVHTAGHLKRIVIDEVHCVSIWGQEFRKEYENLSSLRDRFPNVPIMGLTATVTETVRQDIINKLGIRGCYYFQSSFNRPNLFYSVRPKTNDTVAEVISYCLKNAGKSGIVYCLSRKDTEVVCEKMRQKGVSAGFYHADMPDGERREVQESWMRGDTRVIVATVAFGMGINKPDVRFVLHYTMSKSLENYYQESGRAGRDGQPAECVLYYRRSDRFALQSLNLGNEYSTLRCKETCYKRLNSMIAYCENRSECLRKLQLEYLGQVQLEDCNKGCDNCLAGRVTVTYEAFKQARALLVSLQACERMKVKVSRCQLSAIMKNKIDKKFRPKLGHVEDTFGESQELFRKWSLEEISMLLSELVSKDLVFEKAEKAGSFRGKPINCFYLHTNVANCKKFLAKVNTFPIKGVGSESSHAASPTHEAREKMEQSSLDKYIEKVKLKNGGTLKDANQQDNFFKASFSQAR